MALSGAVCVQGTMAEKDQDLFLWTVSETEAGKLWSLTLTGVPETTTLVEVYPVESEPGKAPVQLGSRLLQFAVQVGHSEPAEEADLLFLPGVYLIGVGRGGTIDGAPTPTNDYNLTIAPDGDVPAVGDVEPNDDAKKATPVEGAFALSGDLQKSADSYAWTLSEQDQERGWELHANGAAGKSMSIELVDPDGFSLVTLQAPSDGRIALYDLGLRAGTYLISVKYSASESLPYIIEMVEAGERPAADAEPNDEIASAAPLELERPAKGRLSASDGGDVYRLAVDAALAGSLFDLKLAWRGGETRELCLLDAAGTRLQCRKGEEGVGLSDMLLPAGEFFVSITGDPDPEDRYVLRLDATTPPAPGFETEPNDAIEIANPLGQETIGGHFNGSERDYFRLLVSGEPQLWDLEVTGTNLREVSLVTAAGTDEAKAPASDDSTFARLSDLYLTPGDHWFAVDGTDGDYTVRATPTGSPTADREHEPNGTIDNAQKIEIGEVRTGRLVEAADTDVYQFFLAAEEHVRIRIEPPVDGDVGFKLERLGSSNINLHGSGPGVPVSFETVLPPGDVTLTLSPDQASTGFYRIVVERLDPFAIPADLEPNNRAEDARPLPPSLTVRGATDLTYDYSDADWFRLPDLTQPTTLTLTLDGDVRLYLKEIGGPSLTLKADTSGKVFTADLPANRPLAVGVVSPGEYGLSLAFASGLVPQPEPEPLSITAALTAPATEVAAYWFEGQRVDATLALTNNGTTAQTLALDVVASHFAWHPTFAEAAVTLAPGETKTVPLTVGIDADAWADVPVRVTARVSAETGAWQTTAIEFVPRRDAPAINSTQVWALPETLLGGLNVARPSLGATIVPGNPALKEKEPFLFDDLAAVSTGFSAKLTDKPVTVTVDLAGAGPVPVAGVTIHPGFSDGFSVLAREFDILLSNDGKTFEVVYSGELSPLSTEQVFAFDTPVEARFAQLQIRSVHGKPSADVILGEWKVIAVPDWAPGGGFNIADPAAGGHVVMMSPQDRDLLTAPKLLDETPERVALDVQDGVKPVWVVGFRDDRAAQIAELQWVDPDGTTPETRVNTVTVEVSLSSPVGPWQPLGTWELTRGADGAIAPFVLDAPAWARFVRFTGDGPAEKTKWEYPATLRVIERGIGEEYRSVLGEWGEHARAAFLEWQNPPAAPVLSEEADDNDAVDQAQPLDLDQAVSGRVQIDRDTDWYRIEVPEGQNTLTLTFNGDPTVGLLPTLYDAAGTVVPLNLGVDSDPFTEVYTAEVEPGKTYDLKLEQPQHSVVFAFDSSLSLLAWQPAIHQALKTFAAEVTPGQEAVNALPVEEQFVLTDWSDDPYAIQTALNAYAQKQTSSGLEPTILKATDALAGRPGSKVILLITDAETSTYEQNAEMWAALGAVQPRIFALHIGAGADPQQEQNFMQDWAGVGAGFYEYARTYGEMNRAFDRAATWLRRPAGYVVTATATFVAPPDVRPGTIQVLGPKVEKGEPPAVQPAAGTAIEIILDTSGSMLQTLEGGRTRMDIATDVLQDLVTTQLPEGAPVALRVFGDEPDSCETNLLVPLQPLDPAKMGALVSDMEATDGVKTPLGASLSKVAKDLKNAPGPKIVVLVTDGEETCDGDPEKAIRKLIKAGVDVHVNIVGFALENDETLRKELKRWAKLGKGTYFDASGAGELGEAIAKAVQAPYRVLDAEGELVATGTVDGAAVSVPTGEYTVEVLTDPVQTYAVTVEPGKKVRLRLEGEDG